MENDLPSFDPNWKRRFNSPPDDLVSDFYLPAFSRSCAYDRAVGFFSSHLLAMISPALDAFVLQGGRMRLITSPANLSNEDLAAMGKGEESRTKLREDLVSVIEQTIPDEMLRDRLQLLTWMIANEKLEVKIALREHPTCFSLFHEKIGVFSDNSGNWMTFTGSPNETVGGACRNAESFPLHRSWANKDQKAYAEDERDRFDAIWAGEVEGIINWTVSDWIQQPMRSCFGERTPKPQTQIAKGKFFADGDISAPGTAANSLLPSLPSSLKLRDYQRKAVNDWLKALGRGIFAMATGTGKTLTALAAATQVALLSAKNNRPILVIVVVPLIDLVNQWRDDAEWFGFCPVICHGGITKRQRDDLKSAFSGARSATGQRAEMVITTAGSLTPRATSSESEHFLQRLLKRHKGDMLFIGDEMHSLGTTSRLKALPNNATYTLGLSATPKRHGDEEGTQELIAYFGEPVIAISIKEAIYKYKVLVEYDYIPSLIELTEDEVQDYRLISARIATAFAKGDEEAAEIAIRERTRLIQHAENKLFRLRELMAHGLKNKTHQIIYVAEGRKPGAEQAQLDEVKQFLTDDFDMDVECYFGQTDSSRRAILQKRLAEGSIHALLAMKCLDEGVDIPSARIGVILASTQNPRQFVQRRGRILRRDPENPKSHAVIHDFIVIPPSNMVRNSDSEKRLVGSELSRAIELADAARNREVKFEIIETAYEHGLSPDVYSWMTISVDDEMESWII